MSDQSIHEAPSESEVIAAAEAMTTQFRKNGMLGHDTAFEAVK